VTAEQTPGLTGLPQPPGVVVAGETGLVVVVVVVASQSPQTVVEVDFTGSTFLVVLVVLVQSTHGS